MDAPLYAKSGHQGTAMALAPLAHVLYSRVMRHDPANPHWPDRDRFILSNGHASILQYSMLYLAGYGLERDDIKDFRQWGSLTPGHPEAHHTTGIEVTTGPLGQGFANAVGMAIAERRLRSQFGEDVINHHTFVIAGDGCFMEGISHEAASLAGHQRLGNLICIYDDNHITIDGNTSLAYSDDVGMRFEAYGWNVVHLGEMADDCDGLEAALLAAKAVTDRPSLLILRSHVAAPSPDWTDHHEAHGNPFTAEQVSRTKAVMGIPDEPFWAPAELVVGLPRLLRRARRDRVRRMVEAQGRLVARRGRVGCLLGGHRNRRVGDRTADASPRARRSPPASPSKRRSTRRSTVFPACSPARPTSPATPAPSSPINCRNRSTIRAGARCTTASASTPWAPPWSAWPCTAESSPPAARSSSSSTTCDRRCASPR